MWTAERGSKSVQIVRTSFMDDLFGQKSSKNMLNLGVRSGTLANLVPMDLIASNMDPGTEISPKIRILDCKIMINI